ncbi:MAG: hypothetical protein M9884_00355 [Rhodocyclaceae bacterium]|jgi:hypothetical protein|nr:hypothetical protein [Rhodocyclaceae bacterium]MCO5095910.1 hypothetical protein [Rhodocyclaceae bacterium]
MDTVGRIRKLGFRKWYERQLVEGHLYLVTCFLGIIMVATCVELYGRRDGLTGTLVALGIGLGGMVAALVGWERYKRIMMVAERIGDHATCTQCKAYAKFNVLDAGRALHQEPVDIADSKEVWLKVHCRKCGNEWTI